MIGSIVKACQFVPLSRLALPFFCLPIFKFSSILHSIIAVEGIGASFHVQAETWKAFPI